MTFSEISNNIDTIENYFNPIGNKFKKIIRYESYSGYLVLLFLISGFGVVPSIILYMLGKLAVGDTYSLSEPLAQHPILLLMWAIFAVMLLYFPYHFSKKSNKLLNTCENPSLDRLFFFVYSAFQNVKEYVKLKDEDYLKKALRFLTKTEFDDLEDKIENAYDIPGLTEEWLLRIHDIININRNHIIPRIADCVEIEEIEPLLQNFSKFLYLQNEEDIEQQEKVHKDSLDRILKLRPYKQSKKFDIRNIKVRTFSSKNLLVRIASFSITIFIVYNLAVVFCYLINSKTVDYSDTIIASLLATTFIGGIGLGKYSKK